MKAEAFVHIAIAPFFIGIGLIYWFVSYEDAGTTMLAAASLLGLLIGGYLWFHSRRIAPRPEDRPDATLAEGAGPVDEFPAPTIWPFVFGLGWTVFATGLIFGIWVILPGAALVGLGLVGLIRQSRGTAWAAQEREGPTGSSTSTSTST